MMALVKLVCVFMAVFLGVRSVCRPDVMTIAEPAAIGCEIHHIADAGIGAFPSHHCYVIADSYHLDN